MLALTIALVAQIRAGQTPAAQDSPLSFRGRADAVVVTAAVERGGRPLAGLKAEDFVLLDNGVRQDIATVSFQSLPIDVTVLFDVSASVTGPVISDLRRAVEALRADLGPADRLRLVTFNMRIRRETDWGATAREIDEHFAAIRPYGSSAVFDAVAAALAAPAPADRRQLVMLFSDGQDSSSITDATELFDIVRRTTPTLAVTLAQPPQAPNNAIAGGRSFFPAPGPSLALPSLPAGVNLPLMRVDAERRSTLTALAGESGGSLVAIVPGLNVPTAFRRILEQFRSSYVLHFVPSGVPAGGLHTLDVRVDRDGATVRARRDVPVVNRGIGVSRVGPAVEIPRRLARRDAARRRHRPAVAGCGHPVMRPFASGRTEHPGRIDDSRNCRRWLHAMALTTTFILAVTASLWSTPTAVAQRSGAQPLNVLLLVIDDIRWDSIGAAGNRIVKTPRIDQLAKEGVRFEQARVTTSICMVSRATLLTGQYMSRHGITAFGSPSGPTRSRIHFPPCSAAPDTGRATSVSTASARRGRTISISSGRTRARTGSWVPTAIASMSPRRTPATRSTS